MSVVEPMPPAVSASINADNPWPGLLAFRERDESYFQGRHAETDDLLRLVMRERLTILFGLSGLGKSSLLQAGLFPRLRREMIFPVYVRLDFSQGQPDLIAQIRTAIVNEASAHGIEAPAWSDGDTLWEYFHRAGHTFWNTRNRPMLPFLAFDQFEEIFTLGQRDQTRAAAAGVLVDQLADLSEGRPSARLKASIDAHPQDADQFSFGRHHYKILLGIREDFLPELEALRTRMPAVALNRLRLRRMNCEAALLVVNQAPHLIDPDVAEQIVRFVAADRHGRPLSDLEVEPALLSVVCRELNEKRARLGEAKITERLLEGSQEQVLADFFDRNTADLGPEVRRFIEDHLLTVSGFRDTVAVENALSTPGVTQDALDQLVDRRLVRREERGGVQRLELTHDLLAGVVLTSRNTRYQKERAEEERLALLRAQEEQQQALLKTQEELERRRKEADRNRRDLKIYGAVAIICLTLTVITSVMARRARDAERGAQSALDAAKKAQATAEESQQRMLSVRQDQLATRNGALVVSALDELSRLDSEASALGKLPADLFTTAEWIANVLFALDQLEARQPERAAWARSMRETLWRRYAAEHGVRPPPTAAEDEQLNQRIRVAGATFDMGSPEGSGIETERPRRRVTVSPFQMQDHEVTNGEYWRFDPRHDPTGGAQLPVGNVSWHQAMAYAEWLSGRLPTEAQWELAARGREGRTYPWGNDPPTCDRANYRECGLERRLPVMPRRERGRTPEGLYDLAGNVREWCRDWWGTYPRHDEKDPLGPIDGDARVVRGGSFIVEPLYLRGAARLFNSPSSTNVNLGFRVVWADRMPN